VIEGQLGPMSEQIGVLDKAVGQTGFLAGSATAWHNERSSKPPSYVVSDAA
jgi:hypothetical protein